MGKLRDRMTADLELRNLSKATKESYLKRVRAFFEYHKLPAERLGEKEVREYLLDRKQKVKPATLGVDIAALRFLYEVTLQRPNEVASIPWPKIPKAALPDILSGSEVIQVLASVSSFKHRTILTTAYGAGFRIKEACALRPEDIDSKRMVIKVRHGKGDKDRYVMLAQNLLASLRDYWRVTRPKPPWMFPGQNPGTHIRPDTVRNALRKSVEKLDLKKKVTPHVLRHSFATHLIETGVDIRTIQVVLGHNSICSTQRYTRVSKAHVARVKSPLDKLGTKEGEDLG